MYNIIFSSKVHTKIHNFIDSYKEVFLKTFTDTWIYYENLIKESYIKTSKRFQREIYYSINDNLKEKIIAKKVIQDYFQTTVLVWNYRLFIDFEEDNQDKIRFIENIEFHKK